MLESLAIASNNIELLRQLDRLGWSADALQTIQRVYKAVVLLSCGTYRPNWKPFSAHLVGVASVVAWDSRDAVRVGAAMAHSALEFGRFPIWTRWPFDRREAFLRGVLGHDIVALVRTYAGANWKTVMNPSTVGSDELVAIQHIKLADMLDDMEDERSPVTTRKKLHVDLSDEKRLADCIQIAERTGLSHLASAYGRLRAERMFSPSITETRDRTFVLRRTARSIA